MHIVHSTPTYKYAVNKIYIIKRRSAIVSFSGEWVGSVGSTYLELEALTFALSALTLVSRWVERAIYGGSFIYPERFISYFDVVSIAPLNAFVETKTLSTSTSTLLN